MKEEKRRTQTEEQRVRTAPQWYGARGLVSAFDRRLVAVAGDAGVRVLRDSVNAGLPGRQVGQAIKAVTSHRTRIFARPPKSVSICVHRDFNSLTPALREKNSSRLHRAVRSANCRRARAQFA